MKEVYLLTGPLEETNRPYALEKIAGIEMCWGYNRQYSTQYLFVMPTNLYGLGNNFHPENSQVIPALIHKFHEAKLANSSEVVVWGTGTPKRAFLYNEDMVDACVFLMNLPNDQYKSLLVADRKNDLQPVINFGKGADVTIKELAETVQQVEGYNCEIVFDETKLDGKPRKLIEVSSIASLGWTARTNPTLVIVKEFEDFVKYNMATLQQGGI